MTTEQARADEFCDEIVTLLPRLGDELSAARDVLVTALDAYVAAASQYDTCMNDWIHRLGRIVETPRAVRERYKATTIDGLPLRVLRPETHLARLLAPAMAQLRGPLYIVADLRQLGEIAPEYVTSRQTHS